MKKAKSLFAMLVAAVMTVTMFCAPVAAQETYKCQLYGEVTDAGQVVSKMVIDFGTAGKVSQIDVDTFKVHAEATTEALREGTDIGSYGDYEIDRKIVKVEAKGQYVTVYFDMSEGATLAYLTSARNVPANLTYTVTQEKALTFTANDGRANDEYMAVYTCDNSVKDAEADQFESVIVKDGINYEFYDAGDADSLIVWFHGNGEGADVTLSPDNNVAQMLANRGTVAWATDEA